MSVLCLCGVGFVRIWTAVPIVSLAVDTVICCHLAARMPLKI
jgi:hypothetical protein